MSVSAFYVISITWRKRTVVGEIVTYEDCDTLSALFNDTPFRSGTKGKNIRSTKHVIEGGSSVSGRYSVP